MKAAETPASLRELIDERRDADRPVAVHVEIGQRGAEMDVVEAVAQKIAHRIADDDGEVVEDGAVEPGDVWLAHRWSARERQEPPAGIRTRDAAGVVIVAPDFAIPTAAAKTLDARVRVVDDEVDAVHAVRYRPFEDRLHYREINGGLKVDDWWDCPSCGAETVIPDNHPPHRACSECDWSVTIPTPGITDEPEET